jgi:hypothetical protein
MSFIDHIKSIAAKFNPKRVGIYIGRDRTPWEPSNGSSTPMAPSILGTIGSASMKPSEAHPIDVQMSPEQIKAHISCFAPDGAKLLSSIGSKVPNTNS